MRKTLTPIVAALAIMAAQTLAAAPADPAQQNAGLATPQQNMAAAIKSSIRSYSQFSIFDDVRIGLDGSTVTLSGRVTMPFKRDAIEERVEAIAGVDKVVNNITVLPASLSDTRLRRAVAQAIYSHPSFWHYASMANPPIHIIVEHGRVTLTGVVTSQTDQMLAFALAQVDGALGVTNELRIEE